MYLCLCLSAEANGVFIVDLPSAPVKYPFLSNAALSKICFLQCKSKKSNAAITILEKTKQKSKHYDYTPFLMWLFLVWLVSLPDCKLMQCGLLLSFHWKTKEKTPKICVWVIEFMQYMLYQCHTMLNNMKTTDSFVIVRTVKSPWIFHQIK